MKIAEIKDIIDFISQSCLDEVNIETEAFKINVKRTSNTQKTVETVVQAVPVIPPTEQSSSAPTPQEHPTQLDISNEKNCVEIKSPMIGTFYISPNPESNPFVKAGDKISVGQVVCIIEAMKLFNEIESEVSGTIIKILVDNSSPVEFEQPLFLISPS